MVTPPPPLTLYVTGTERPFVDGFGVAFDPQTHLDHIRVGQKWCADNAGPTPPPVEPQWTDRPAGFRVCPELV